MRCSIWRAIVKPGCAACTCTCVCVCVCACMCVREKETDRETERETERRREKERERERECVCPSECSHVVCEKRCVCVRRHVGEADVCCVTARLYSSQNKKHILLHTMRHCVPHTLCALYEPVSVRERERVRMSMGWDGELDRERERGRKKEGAGEGRRGVCWHSRKCVVPMHCNALQRTATHCTTLQHTATHCNILKMSPFEISQGKRKAQIPQISSWIPYIYIYIGLCVCKYVCVRVWSTSSVNYMYSCMGQKRRKKSRGFNMYFINIHVNV